MPRPKNRFCIVCGEPCVGKVCKTCFNRHSNRGYYTGGLHNTGVKGGIEDEESESEY